MNNNMTQKEKIIKTLNDSFERHKHRELVIYGLGQYTKDILENNKKFNIVGLMSNEESDIGKSYFDLRVFSFDEVIEKKPIIVIVAREELEQVILEEIIFLNEKHGIEIFFKNGSVAKLLPKQKYNISWEASFEDLFEKTKQFDVVSFDVFDTLLTRAVEKPADIFNIVDHICVEKFANKFDYLYLRREAEFLLTDLIDDPTIHHLYEKMVELDSDFKDYKTEVLQIELDVESNFLIPRKELVKLYKQLLSEGKIIILTTDMYLPKEFIDRILCSYGIDGYNEIYVSSIEGKNKKSGELFNILNKTYSGKILHIGDNLVNDIESANKNGIETYHILSNRDYLLSSSLSKIISLVKTNSDKISVGLLADKLFNSPFRGLNKTNGVPKISSFHEFGYIVYGPLMFGYLSQLINRSLELRIDKIFFCAREGLLFRRLYEKIKFFNQKDNLPCSVYFKTSRRMASAALIRSWMDIENSFSRHRYIGKFFSLMNSRFGVELKPEDKFYNEDVNTSNDLNKVLQMLRYYENKILKEAEIERDAFVKYINSLCDFNNEKVVISDQGNSGTVQLSIESILETNKNLFGFYVCADKKINPYSLERFEGYLDPTIHEFLKSNHLFESVFTAPEGTYIKCNSDGSFSNGTRQSNQKKWLSKEKIYEGISSYFDDYMRFSSQLPLSGCNADLSDTIFGLINNGKVIIDDSIKDTFYFDNLYVRESENKIVF